MAKIPSTLFPIIAPKNELYYNHQHIKEAVWFSLVVVYGFL